MTVLDLARYQVFRHLNISPVLAVLRKAERATPKHNLDQLTVRQDGKLSLPRAEALAISSVRAGRQRRLLQDCAAISRRSCLRGRSWFAQYHVEDVAFRVVGTGSVGIRDYVVLMFGRTTNDPLFIQIKEEDDSAYAPYCPRAAFS